jgi:hypothetical protein
MKMPFDPQRFLVVLGAAAALVALAVLVVTRSAASEAKLAELVKQVAQQGETLAQQIFVTKQMAEAVEDVSALKDRLASSDRDAQAQQRLYEDLGRGLIAQNLGPRFGLRIVDGAVGPSRAEGEIFDPASADPPAQWDYRMPVVVLGTPPLIPMAAKDFVIYNHNAYVCPPAPAQERHLAPTKAVRGGGRLASADEPLLILCHFMVIFEITMAKSWVARKVLARLERRLYISLDRARAQDQGINNILDVVAVVGIVAPNSFTREVVKNVVKTSYPHLHAMMTAGRFVWLMKAAIATGGSPRTVASAPAVLARK